MDGPRVETNIVLTPEQIAHAPEAVREWLRALYGNDDRLEHAFILERYGAATSGDGLAVCSSLEIKNLLHLISNDFLSCQILFELGCDYRNPTTGERRGHLVRLPDFLHHTDAHNIMEVERSLDAINAALQRLRHDSEATIYRPDGHGGYHVHETTQHSIYQLWRRFLRLTARHHDMSKDEHQPLLQLEAQPRQNGGNPQTRG